MADIDKGTPLMTPTFFDDNDPDNPKRKTYIERKEAIEFVRNNTPHFDGETTMQCVERSLANVPAADVVSSAVLEQVMWERNMALEMLKEHGIGFCEKSDVVEVVRCKDCRYFVPVILNGKVQERGYCNLGCDWVNRQETDFCNYGKRKGD